MTRESPGLAAQRNMMALMVRVRSTGNRQLRFCGSMMAAEWRKGQRSLSWHTTRSSFGKDAASLPSLLPFV